MGKKRILFLVLLLGAVAYLVWLATRPPTVIEFAIVEDGEPAPPGLAIRERDADNSARSPPVDPARLLAELESGDFERQRKAYLGASGELPYHEGLARWLVGKLTAGGWLSLWSKWLLGKMGPAASEQLGPLFRSQDVYERRAAVAVAVIWNRKGGKFGGAPLLDLLQDPDRQVRNVAWNFAASGIPYDPKLAAHLLSTVEPVNGVAFNGPEVALARMGPQGIAHLLAMLDDPSEDLWLNALGGLAAAPREEIKKLQPRLAAFIRNKDEEVAYAAIEVLTRLEGDSDASVAALADALSHESVIVLDVALQVFELMGPRAADAVSAVLKLLDYDHERIVNRAAGVLGQLQAAPEIVMPALARAAKDDVSEAAAAALAAFGSQALPHALAAYEESDDDGRYALLLTFSALGPSAASAVPLLIRELESDDYLMQTRALRVLGRIGPDAAAAVPSVLGQMGAETIATNTAVNALIRMGERGEAAALDLLRTKDDKRRREVVMVLSFNYGRTSFALDELARIARADPDPATRRAALQAAFVAMCTPDRPWTNAKADPVLVERVRAILQAHREDADRNVRSYTLQAIDEMPGG